jgi:hypothetical protein
MSILQTPNFPTGNLQLSDSVSNIQLPSQQAPQTQVVQSTVPSAEDLEKRKAIESAFPQTITNMENARDDLQRQIDEAKKYKSGLSINDNTEEVMQIDSYINDLRTRDYQMFINLQLIDGLKNEINQKKKQKEGENIAEEDRGFKWNLKDIGLLMGAIGSGFAIAEGALDLFGENDLEPIDTRQAIRDSVSASTDPEVADAVINAGYRDNPRLTDMENLANYRNQFGSLTNDMFNSNVGQELEQAYQTFKVKNPTTGRDQFLVEFARNDPTNPVAQEINKRLSRTDQINRTAKSLSDSDRALTLEGFGEARKFYQPVEQGGYGFKPQDFRSDEQQRVIDSAFGLMDSSESKLLKDSVAKRVMSGGQLGTDELRDITGMALTSVDPSLQNQQYLNTGGLARSVLNTTQAKRNRLMQDEGALNTILGREQNFIGNLNNVVASNTVDPVNAFGLKGSNSQLASNIYSSNPTKSLNYDPTSSFYSSIIGANNNIDQANSINSTSSTLKDMSAETNELNRILEG